MERVAERPVRDGWFLRWISGRVTFFELLVEAYLSQQHALAVFTDGNSVCYDSPVLVGAAEGALGAGGGRVSAGWLRPFTPYNHLASAAPRRRFVAGGGGEYRLVCSRGLDVGGGSSRICARCLTRPPRGGAAAAPSAATALPAAPAAAALSADAAAAPVALSAAAATLASGTPSAGAAPSSTCRPFFDAQRLSTTLVLPASDDSS